MDAKAARTLLRAALHVFLTLQQVGGYTYRNQRKFTEDIDWSYDGTLNQNNWHKKFPSCSNAKQSPIDVEENLAQVELRYQKLQLDGWENFTGQRTTIKNDGKTVALDVDGDFYVGGGGLASKFKAGRIAFHWGRCNASSEGSEHSLDGVKYPLEMQIYCFEPQRFDSFQQTVKAGGRITALAVLFEANSEEDNAHFAAIIDAINSVSRYGKSARVSPFRPRALLPNSTDKYFIYNGSLTTPPCSETVEWIVFKNTVSISAEQLEAFCEVMTMQQAGYAMLMDYLQNNYREQQRNFMGQVFSSYTGTEELLTPVCSSEPENAEVSAYNGSSLLVTWERPRAVYDSAIERYSVSYKMADAEDAARSEYLTDGDQDVGAILDDLAANCSYVVQVVAVCANGLYGRVSDPLTFTVPADGPGNSPIPDSIQFDYEGEYYPPDPNESEDYVQAPIPTKPPATWTSGPSRRPTHQIESTSVAATFAQHTASKTEASGRSSSLSPPYGNARDHRDGVQQKSWENSKAALNPTAPTLSAFTASISNDTVTRAIAATVSWTTNGTTAPKPKTTKIEMTTASRALSEATLKTAAVDTTMETTPFSTPNKTETTDETTAVTTNPSTKNTIGQTGLTTKTTNQIATANTTTETTASPAANKTGTPSRNKTATTNEIATANTTTETTASPAANKTGTPSRNKTATTNEIATANTTTETTASPAANKTGTPSRNKTASTNEIATANTTTETTDSPAANKTGTPSRNKTATTNEIATANTTTETTASPTANKTGTPSRNKTATTTAPFTETATPKPTDLSDFTPVRTDPHEVRTADDAQTRVWRGGVLLRTTPPLPKGERHSVPAPSSHPIDVTSPRPSLRPVPPARLHELTADATPPPVQIPASPDSRPAPSFADGLASFSSGGSLPEVSLGTPPLPGQDPSSLPALSSANELAYFSLRDLADASEQGGSVSEAWLSLSPTLRPSVLLSSDQAKEAEFLGYGTGSTVDSEFSDAICACSLEPSASWPLAPPHRPLGVATSGFDADLLLSSSGVLVSSFSGAASGGSVVALSPSLPAPDFPMAARSAAPPSVAASLLPSLPFGSGVSGSGVDQDWDGVEVSASGESARPHATDPPLVTLESGRTLVDLDDRPSAFYFDGESGSDAGSGRAGAAAASPSAPALPSPVSPEESGSGRAENPYDNDASSDFSIPEQTRREAEREAEPVADVSNSGHESRVGSVGDGERKAAVPLAVISALTALGLAVLVGVLVYWRVCFQTAHFYVDEGARPHLGDAAAFASDPKAALPVQDFVRHVAELHRTSGFQRKFELLKESYEEVQARQADMTLTSETSNHPDNKSKNRYGNILAFDHSRVRLSAGVADKDGRCRDYINANFVDGFKMRHAYIAAQGPLESTADDFWRMIWEQNVGVIVMITNLLEKGRRKCDQYWPADARQDYGGLAVALQSVQELAHYTRRTFAVTDTRGKKASRTRRVVTQYQYTRWPDMGVPDHALPLLDFIRQSSRARTANMGPVVVHCSAGVGRTGAYLVLDSMLRQMRQEDAVDVDGFLRHIRTQRNFLVQTQEQYVFIHDALAEAILCGDTEVAASRLHAYVERLLTPLRDGNTPLDRQLELLSAEATNGDDSASALSDGNRQKNRSRSLLPVERSRVRLSPCAGDPSDYINASYVTGYRRSKEFIITQNPLPGTVKDFWRMIWEHDVRVIVSLPGPACAQDEEEEAEPCAFWPAKGHSLSWETLSVTQTCENVICLANEDALLVHHLAVHVAQDDFVAEVRLYRAPRWPDPDGAISDTFLLVRLIREETAAKEGATALVDRLGGVTAGTFCALSSLMDQLSDRRRVDVFGAARMTNLARPGTFRTRDHLEFLYKALLSVLDEPGEEDRRDRDQVHLDDESQDESRPMRSAASCQRNGALPPLGGKRAPNGLDSLV
ncbi:receptor-type tyrosine-protein phosphatase gamma [Hippocampus zosterae]|uniref:receptor-type tyrosine-protein phosphatase gamma n=1 Tax=Hippocampus zosterae TaxID=109293 RepID=UPI00223DFFDC|nr:receptor-type tyrosine-protein phosphatase gamma [Hippocampus zosterae]